MRLSSLFAALAMLAASAAAQETPDLQRDIEAETMAVARTLRCVVCKNQSIAESDADLAKSLVRTVRDRIKAGDTQEEARAYIVERYGEFVLLKPVFGWRNVVLWAGPAVFLLFGLGGAFAFIATRRGSTVEAPAPLSAEETAELERLTGDR